VYSLKLRIGRSLRATANHRFLTVQGWKRLDQLASGDRIALPRTLPGPARPRLARTNRDVVPRDVWTTLAIPAMRAAGISTRQMQAALGTPYCGTSLYKQNVGRERADRLARAVRSQELAALAQSDVYWDEISEIRPAGEADVYDLTVEGHHNFVANGITVHNSIEQDADIVMFIYRDVMYNPETERPHVADVLVAKHRNGPTGKISLFFQESLMKFFDLRVRQDE
jgi:replicative DNA helicase